MAEPSKEKENLVPTDPAIDPANAAASTSTSTAAAPAGEEGGEGATSKKGAKKAEAKAKKEAEKARKAAEQEAQRANAKAKAEQDLAKDNYGDVKPVFKLSTDAEKVPQIHLRNLGEEHIGKTVKVRAWIQNARMQGAKMAFVELREEGNWTVQGVVAATATGEGVSKQMVKYIGGLKLESFVVVEASVQKPLEPVKSCKVSDFELHLQKVYLVAAAPEMLGLSLAPASRAVGRLDDEDINETAAAVEGMLLYYFEEKEMILTKVGLSITEGTPLASLSTHLNNPAMHKRAPVSQAIADIRIAVEDLFCDFLRQNRFKKFHPPSLIGAASEGGANVFKLPYFDKEAYLAQSPQFYKQFEIAGGRKRVYCVGPVFRAENSNTPRHLTEVCVLLNSIQFLADIYSSSDSISRWRSKNTIMK